MAKFTAKCELPFVLDQYRTLEGKFSLGRMRRPGSLVGMIPSGRDTCTYHHYKPLSTYTATKLYLAARPVES